LVSPRDCPVNESISSIFHLGKRFGALGQQTLAQTRAMSFCVMISRTFRYGDDPKD